MNKLSSLSGTLAVSLMVGGCGLRVPELQNLGGGQQAQEADENTILNHIKCEIHFGVQNTLYDPRFYPPTTSTGKSPKWLLDWGAKVTYVLTDTEKNTLNPGLSYTNPFSKAGTLFSLGGGLETSAEAQRRETGAVTYAFSDLLKEAPIRNCDDQNGILIHSNLRIAEFISNKVFPTRVPGTTPDKPVSIDDSKPLVLNAFTDEITFTVAYGASITPSWTFVRLSVNPNSPLYGASRTNIQYVTITIGKVQSPSSSSSAAQLSQEAQILESANLIGHAVSTALRGTSTISSTFTH